MLVNQSGATFSSIVGIGNKLKKLQEETGQQFLFLNRGINAVCNIDIREVIKQIDFESSNVLVYPVNKGSVALRQAINDEFFAGKTTVENISICGGGMAALDLTIQTLKLDKVYYAKYFWGSYAKLCKIRQVPSGCYESLDDLIEKLSQAREPKNNAVLICDPNNPLGNKMEDEKILRAIEKLNALGAVVIFDSPYRRIFYSKDEDTFFQKLLQFENVIIAESFSKSLGLSGQRLAFIHCQNVLFNEELNIRILYSTNGVNAFAQELIYRLLATPEGRKAVTAFKKKTVSDIEKNISFLEKNGLLYQKLYQKTKPVGIFAVVNRSEEELLKFNIGSVSMKYFTEDKTSEEALKTARICVSVPHEQFKTFFSRVIKVNKEAEVGNLEAVRN